MRANILLRVENEALFLIEHNATVRSVAKAFGVSKSTVHVDLTVRLQKISFAKKGEVAKILKTNLAERHLRGGEATKKKFLSRSSAKRRTSKFGAKTCSFTA